MAGGVFPSSFFFGFLPKSHHEIIFKNGVCLFGFGLIFHFSNGYACISQERLGFTLFS